MLKAFFCSYVLYDLYEMEKVDMNTPGGHWVTLILDTNIVPALAGTLLYTGRPPTLLNTQVCYLSANLCRSLVLLAHLLPGW